MYELCSTIDDWMSNKIPIALAKVVGTWESSPRGIGSKMVINQEGEMAGSVSAGCVEAAVVEEAMDVIKRGKPKLVRFGVTDENTWDVGLSCGGVIEVFVQVIDEKIYELIKSSKERREMLIWTTILQGPSEFIGKEKITVLGNDSNNFKYAHSHYHHSNLIEIDPKTYKKSFRSTVTGHQIANTFNVPNSYLDSKFDLFFDVIRPIKILIIIGGVHIAIPLVQIAKAIGYQTIIVDPRSNFASHKRFPHADRIINLWPITALLDFQFSPFDAVAVLSHDPKIDDPALELVLRKPVFYVGALGSRKTQRERRVRLLAAGLTEEQVNKIKGPIGLDLGERTPEEIALAIMAEIVKEKNKL